MAVTKIWPVRDRFDKVLDYAANAKKTDADLEKLHALDNVIDYAADGDKTEKCFYVSGVNCLPENAKETFAASRSAGARRPARSPTTCISRLQKAR